MGTTDALNIVEYQRELFAVLEEFFTATEDRFLEGIAMSVDDLP